jgi:hypothetical protein
MANREIDQFIPSTVGSNWQKVAMLIAKALLEPGLSISGAGDDAETVAGCIEGLIGRGELELHGNLSNWRYSEIRRVIHPTGAA